MKYLLTVFVAMIFAISGLAQGPETQKEYEVDFTGKWQSVSVTRDKGLALSPALQVQIELTVNQSGHELRLIDRTIGRRGPHLREATYYLDGRGELNKGESRSKTRVEKRYLKIQYLTGDFEDRFGSEDWELSQDGETLTIENRLYSPTCRDDRTITVCATENYTYKFKRVN